MVACSNLSSQATRLSVVSKQHQCLAAICMRELIVGALVETTAPCMFLQPENGKATSSAGLYEGVHWCSLIIRMC